MTETRRKPAPDAPTGPATVLSGLVAADWIAVLLTLLWLLAVGLFFLFMPRAPEPAAAGPVQSLMVLLAITMPVALVWIGAVAAKTARRMQAENDRLLAAITKLEAQAALTPQQAGQTDRAHPLEQKLEDIARAQRKTEAALARFTALNTQAMQAAPARRVPASEKPPEPAAPKVEAEQGSLALDAPAQEAREPISADEFIRALNFPADEYDREGFRALRRALADHRSAPLVRSAQDILTLLAEDGIYVDDLTPDRARPELWRRFAEGARGPVIAGLGGIRDRTSLARTAGRMRQDAVFRDCAHHFLRRFDTTLASFEKTATDAEIIAFADTRSARAFMLVGRVSGTFD